MVYEAKAVEVKLQWQQLTHSLTWMCTSFSSCPIDAMVSHLLTQLSLTVTDTDTVTVANQITTTERPTAQDQL